MRPPEAVLNQFYQLAELDNEKRLAAVHAFVSQNLDEHRTYCLERLIGGLSSPRAAARLGYATALTELFRKDKANVSCDEILSLADKKLVPAENDENPSAAAVGQYLLCLSMIASDAFTEELPKIAQRLDELKTKHKFLSTACAQGMLSVSEKVDKSTFKTSIWPLLVPTLALTLAAHTPDSLWLLLSLRSQFSSIMSKQVDFLNKDGSLKLTEADYPVLKTLLKKPDPMTIHPVIGSLVDFGLKSGTFDQLYSQVIEEWAFLGDDFRVAQRGFEVACKILSRDDLTDKEIVAVFSENLVTKIEGALKSFVNQRFLADLVKRLVDSLSAAIGRTSMSQKLLLRLLQRCDVVPLGGFDHLTGTKLTDEILAKLNIRGVTKMLDGMETDVEPHAIRRLQKIFQAASDNEIRVVLLTKLAAWCGTRKEHKEVCSAAFGGCIESLLVVSVRPGKARIELSTDHLQLLIATATAIVGGEQQHEHLSPALKVVAQMVDKEGDVARGFATLTVYLLLWALTAQQDDDYAENIQEVLMCWKRYLKPAANEPKYISVLLDLLLQLLSKPQKYIRPVVQTVFRYVVNEITIDTLAPIFETLNAADGETLTGEDDDDDGDEFAPIGSMQTDSDDELESDRSSEDSALESEDDEEAAANGVDAELVGSLTKALGDAAVADESDAESVQSDVSDATMMRLDEGLAAAFRTHLNKSQASRKDVAAQARIFRGKCFDLLLILVNVTESKTLILDLLIPLIKTANDALKKKEHGMAFDKATSLLEMICKTKKFDIAESKLSQVSDALFEISSAVLNPVLQTTIGNVAGFLFGLALHGDGVYLEATKKKHEALLRKYFEDRECHVLGDIISAPIIRYPEHTFELLPVLLAYAFNEEIRIFRRTEALSWSIAFFRRDLLLTEDKQKNKTWRKYAKTLAERLCELLAVRTEEEVKLLKPRYFAEAVRLLFVFSTYKGNPHISLLAENESLIKLLDSLKDPKVWKKELVKASGAIHKAIGKPPHKIFAQIDAALTGSADDEPPAKRTK